MARAVMGVIGGRPAVKVTRSNADDPKTTPDTDYAKFAFNSTHEQAIIASVEVLEWDDFPQGAQGTTSFHYLDGTDASNSLWRVIVSNRSDSNGLDYGFSWLKVLEFLAANAGIDYHFMFEARSVVDGWFEGPDLIWDERVSGVWGYYFATLGQRGFSSWIANEAGYTGYRGYVALGGSFDPAFVPGNYVVGMAWRLPANNAALPADGVPVPGQKVVEINQSGIRIARTGYDVRTAAKSNFILNSDVVPAKVIMSGVTEVGAGATVHVANSSPFPLTEHMYLDVLVNRVGEPLRHPAVTYASTFSARDFRCRWRIDVANNRISFENTSGYAISVRWYVCASDPNPPTSGGGKVVYRGSSGGQDFVQIKRPGSSDVAPGLNDILLDTRLYYLRIADEGFLPTAQFTATDDIRFGELRTTVNFANSGFTPFLKFSLVTYDPATARYSHLWPEQLNFRVNKPTVVDDGNWHDKPHKNSSLALLNDDNVVFYINPSAPVTLEANQGPQNPYTQGVFDNSYSIAGIRYFIFALPQI